MTQPGAPTILLVDDNAELRELFAETLSSHGYKVLEASDGVSAMEILSKTPDPAIDPVRLVITDMNMPKIGGRELHRRASQLIKDIKFIYISGYFEGRDQSAPNANDQSCYLQKPFTEELLLEKVQKALES